MDARYARGRTALVERRECFYGLGNRMPGHLAPLFPKTQFLKYTKRVSRGLFLWDLLATPGPRKEQTPYRPTRLAHRASLVGLERKSGRAFADRRPTTARAATIDSASLAEHHSCHDHV